MAATSVFLGMSMYQFLSYIMIMTAECVGCEYSKK